MVFMSRKCQLFGLADMAANSFSDVFIVWLSIGQVKLIRTCFLPSGVVQAQKIVVGIEKTGV